MRKRYTWMAVSGVILLVVIGMTALWRMGAVGQEDGEMPVPSTVTMPYRILGEWEGQVAVFLPDADTPETVYDTPLLTLPAEEQERLKKGIEVVDRQTLLQLLEDYLS